MDFHLLLGIGLCLLCYSKATALPIQLSTNCLDKAGSCNDVITESSTQTLPCTDYYPHCSILAQNHLCRERFIAENCRKSCLVCGATTTVTPITRHSIDVYDGPCGIPRVYPVLLKIYGGSSARYGSIPWQVTMRNPQGFHFCGGTLISNKHVITAAHCAERYDVGRIFGYLGKHRVNSSAFDKGQKRVTFSSVDIHPEYSNITYDNDIALLTMDSPIIYTTYIRPVCLPNHDQVVPPGTIAKVSGWGTTLGAAPSKVLLQVDVPTISNSICNSWLFAVSGKAQNITSNMLCAGYEAGGKDACQEDSGGPLVVRRDNVFFLNGVVSWGYGCGAIRQPGVYAKISNKINWIRNLQAN